MAFHPLSQVALYSSVFLSCVSFAIVMPSLWPFLRSLNSSSQFLGLVVAIYSVGEALGAVYYGRRANKISTTVNMLHCTYWGFAGAACYVIAERFPNLFGRLLVLFGRFIQGIWTGGAQALQPPYLSDVLSPHQITPAIVNINASATLGFVVGPVLGYILTTLPETPLALGLTFNQLTGPGYFVLLSTILIIVLFFTIFQEQSDRAAAATTETDALLEQTEADKQQLPSAEPRTVSLTSFPIIAGNIIFFIHFLGFALQETVTTPLVEKYYGWEVQKATLLFTGAGFFALASFVGVHIASRRYSDRAMTMSSLVMGLVGYALLVSTDEHLIGVCRFLYGFAVISVAFPVGRATTIALATKLAPPQQQGDLQGALLAVGAVARILGSFWAVRAFTMENGGAIVFGVAAALFAAGIFIMAAAYPGMKGETNWN